MNAAAAPGGIMTSRSRHDSRNRHGSSSSGVVLPPSNRTSVSSRYCAEPCAAASVADSTQLQAVSDDYMQPVNEGTSTPVYHSVIEGKRAIFVVMVVFFPFVL